MHFWNRCWICHCISFAKPIFNLQRRRKFVHSAYIIYALPAKREFRGQYFFLLTESTDERRDHCVCSTHSVCTLHFNPPGWTKFRLRAVQAEGSSHFSGSVLNGTTVGRGFPLELKWKLPFTRIRINIDSNWAMILSTNDEENISERIESIYVNKNFNSPSGQHLIIIHCLIQ